MAAAATARHHGDGTDLRSRDALAVMRERARHVGARALMTGALQHQIHESRAPQAASTGGVATSDIAARRFDDARIAKAHAGLAHARIGVCECLRAAKRSR